MWPWTHRRTMNYDIGAVFRSAETKKMIVETATVLGRFDDPTGIPHIRYQLRLQTPTGASDSLEQRVLALSAFTERYSQYCGQADGAAQAA